jgi:glucokinase
MRKYAIGSDIGGSHISCAVIDLEKEVIIKESFSTVKVDNQASSQEILDKWTSALNNSLSFIDSNQLAGIGFAMPGPFDYEKGIAMFTESVAKYQNLYGINISAKIKEKLRLPDDTDVRFINDASAFAVGEAWLGGASKVNRSVSITLGTGFGSAFIDKGIVIVERDDVPKMGCLWHLPFKEGIADDYFSTRWFIKKYSEASGIVLTGVKEIADLVTKGEKSDTIFIEFGENLGEFIGPWLNKFGAEVLVIGGNVAGAYNLFGKQFEETLRNQNVETGIYISTQTEDYAIIGSARLFNTSFWEQIRGLLPKM